MALLELQGVKRVYRQGQIEVLALQGIDLTVETGEFTSIAGPSGSGKTTLLNLIGCLDRPTAGKVCFNNRKLAGLSKKELALVRRYNLGFIFQDFNLIPVLTVYENVEFALRLIADKSKKEIEKKLMEILRAVGLGDLKDRRPNELSGGQKQRVSVARALVKEPKLVLADEPTANLDSETSHDVLKVMVEMNKKLDTTFIFSTHDPLVMDYAGRLIQLKDGQIIEDKKRD